MRIAIDAMGGDHAPEKILQGALDSLDLLDSNDELILVGRQEVIDPRLPPTAKNGATVRVLHASDVIAMDESPVDAVRKKRDSSIVKMVKLAAAGGADAIISAGNTGALVAAGVLMLKGLPGVERPGIACTVPTPHGVVMLCDAGANVTPKPSHLHQYAVLASVYMQALHHIENPRVGLLNVGTEEEKGTPLVKETRVLLENDKSLHFVGYVEGRELFKGVCDVAVTDGFTGNIMLKVMEGMNTSFMTMLQDAAREQSAQALADLKPVLSCVSKRYDHEEYGGALLLGVAGLFFKVHGSAGPRAIRNAVRSAKEASRLDVNNRIVQRLAPAVA